MKNIIAKVRLAAGNVGWFDQLTNIHLTITRPVANVYEGMNTTNLKRGVQYKTITVVSGSLEPAPVIDDSKKEEFNPQTEDVTQEDTPNKVVVEEPAKESIEDTTEVKDVEDTVEPEAEAPVEKKSKTASKKTTSKKTTSKKTAKTEE